MKPSNRWNRILRGIKASLRDTRLLFREFRWALLSFLIAVVGGGILFDFLYEVSGHPTLNVFESIYDVLLLTFLQPTLVFPGEWYLEVFYFAMPVIGIVIFAQGIADFGAMLFNRRTRSKEWEMAVASTFYQHNIVIGLGHLGYRVARNLYELNQETVVVEHNPKADLVARVKELDIPVIQDDASRESALEAAGIKRAQAVVICTQNDSLNLQIALKARRVNPDIRIIIRIFEADFAQALQEQFGFTAFSATNMAAPAFASAAAGLEMTNPLTIEGTLLSLARLTLPDSSPLAQMTVGDLETHYNVSAVLLRRNNESDLHPAPSIQLMAGDALGVLGTPAEISLLVKDNLFVPK
jgi:voltage-gated potassium channel